MVHTKNGEERVCTIGEEGGKCALHDIEIERRTKDNLARKEETAKIPPIQRILWGLVSITSLLILMMGASFVYSSINRSAAETRDAAAIERNDRKFDDLMKTLNDRDDRLEDKLSRLVGRGEVGKVEDKVDILGLDFARHEGEFLAVLARLGGMGDTIGVMDNTMGKIDYKLGKILEIRTAEKLVLEPRPLILSKPSKITTP